MQPSITKRFIFSKNYYSRNNLNSGIIQIVRFVFTKNTVVGQNSNIQNLYLWHRVRCPMDTAKLPCVVKSKRDRDRQSEREIIKPTSVAKKG